MWTKESSHWKIGCLRYLITSEQLSRCCSLIESSMDKQDMNCQSNSDVTNKVSSNEVSTAVVSLLHDEKEKEKRCMSLIIHNLPGSDATTGNDRKQHDISKATEVFNQHLGLYLPKSRMPIGLVRRVIKLDC